MNKKRIRKFILYAALFITIMGLTFWNVFRGQDFEGMLSAIGEMSGWYLLGAVFLALSFVAGEGCMIWYLLKGIGEEKSLFRCFSYSFTGFFFSGITPSASGGQPMQLYYMKRDGCSFASSFAVLMTIAVLNKLAMALLGTGILLLWGGQLQSRLEGYYGLFCLGLLLHIGWVIILFLMMFRSAGIRKILYRLERIPVRLRLWKESEERLKKIDSFFAGYQETVEFLQEHKKMIVVTVAGSLLQRCCPLLLVCAVYLGLGLQGSALHHIFLLQAAVSVAVEMLPIPGAQGVTEAMYGSVFGGIFPGHYLVASICITRGINFYFLLAVGGFWVLLRMFRERKKGGSRESV
ncbi:MAG: flippase-like domain-containing protein [Butyrivibrio sp.]|nr:flippase-like domain-containing protein [Acetatifactor muris]MCM1560323.1 flippase-like domain-containing protein [Butyrivibrio sp.]